LRLGSFDIESEPPVKSRFLWLVCILGIDLPGVDFDINNSLKNRDFLITCAFSERVRDIAFVPNETPPTLSQLFDQMVTVPHHRCRILGPTFNFGDLGSATPRLSVQFLIRGLPFPRSRLA
jgi:hypothetical protein